MISNFLNANIKVTIEKFSNNEKEPYETITIENGKIIERKLRDANNK